ncbi:MAG: diadenylate cyclase CdaA [Dethiobacter sp.]|jgi:diadenylate cyclase|nr:diadenylate cyclase CdaA [Dethiobacter sp.]MBS3901543.1 diadenylate cyclase CdaA [Dethiobacter sp.]MBS3989435.1 diadenylate cyclase CdaA [Dethiobacter sp.]
MEKTGKNISAGTGWQVFCGRLANKKTVEWNIYPLLPEVTTVAQFLQIITALNWLSLLDIALVTYVFYKAIILIRGTRAEQLVKGLAVLLITTVVSGQIGLHTFHWLLRNTMAIGLVAIAILFQPELRRALETLGRGKIFTRSSYLYADKDFELMLDELIKAVQVLVKKRLGALIVLERETGLNELIETGIYIDGQVTAELLINIFLPRSPLHDGAVIVRGSRMMAAGCYLPLTENPNLSTELGTRHRAALGVSEQSDAVAIVVSEETGVVSITNNGKLTRYLDEKTLKQLLINLCKPPAQNQSFWQWRSN